MEKTWILFYLLWSSALQAKPTNSHTEPDDVRLVGASRCAGWLVVKRQRQWRAVYGLSDWNMKLSSVVCRQLGCGSAVDTDRSSGSAYLPVWWITASCVGSEASLRECGVTEKSDTSSYTLQVICSESVRLENGPGLCSGRVEVKSNQSWVSVCEGDFDQQDAEVVCRQLACGAPSVLQGALYGEVKAPMWTKEFQCDGSESNLLDCGTSDSTRKTCSPDKTVGLTCSEPDDVRLVGGASRCAGRLEMKHHGEWRPGADDWPFEAWSMKASSVLCRQLGCGSAVYTDRRDGSTRQPVWKIRSSCVGSESSLGECGTKGSDNSSYRLEVICSDLLFKPILSVSCPMKGVSEGQHQGPWVMEGFNFSMDCSVRPQYPGGSFQLTSTGAANATHTYYTQTAVNHSAHFLFPAADHGHQGNYSCVYHVAVFGHDLTSESDFLCLTVKASPLNAFFIRVTVVMLVLWGQFIFQYVFWKRRATRGQSAAVENIEMA